MGLLIIFFGLIFFTELTPNRRLMNVKKQFNIFSRIYKYIRADKLTFRGLSAEGQIFPWIIPQKGLTFQGIILRKSKLSTDYTTEGMPLRRIICGKACNRKLFHVKADFTMVKSAERFDFSRSKLRKGILFCRIIHGKSKLSVNHSVGKSMPFSQGDPREVKFSANYPAESFSIPRKVKISLCKGLSLLLQKILDKKSTMGDHYIWQKKKNMI